MSTAALPKTIAVKIYAPFKIYFEGTAISLSAINATGPFDILPGHKNFISLLKPCVIKVRQENNQEFTLKIDRGVIHVKSGQATVFLDI